MRRSTRFALAVLALVALSAGACRTGDGGGFLFGSRKSRVIRVTVENDNFLDVTIYAVGGGASFRLGDVTGKHSANFTIDPDRISLNSGLQLLVDPVGSSTSFLSQRVFVDRGATVFLQVAPDLKMSHISLR